MTPGCEFCEEAEASVVVLADLGDCDGEARAGYRVACQKCVDSVCQYAEYPLSPEWLRWLESPWTTAPRSRRAHPRRAPGRIHGSPDQGGREAMADVRAALTPERWAAFHSGRKHTPADEQVSEDARALGVTEDEVRRGHWADAAQSLYLAGQPFGFTWEDVDLLREEAKEYEFRALPDPSPDVLLNALADRIAALLPPRP